jgi:putative salt-induced outer membrane protein YdiY
MLRGETVKIEDGILYFKSETLGLLELEAGSVVVQTTSSLKKPTSGQKQVSSDRPFGRGTRFPSNMTKGKPHDWNREVEFGFNTQSGRSEKTNILARFQMDKRTEANNYRFQSRFLYGESNNEESTNTITSNFRWRRDISPTLFGQSLTSYSNDQIKRVDHDASQGFGVGRKFVPNDNIRFSLGSGATARYRDEEELKPEWEYLIDAFQELSIDISSRLQITQDMLLFVSPQDSNSYTVLLNAALVGKVTERIKMTMRYEYEYDGSLLPENRTNQRVLTSLGYIF